MLTSSCEPCSPPLAPESRDLLRRVLVMDQSGRDDVAFELLRLRDDAGDDLADTIDIPAANGATPRIARHGSRAV